MTAVFLSHKTENISPKEQERALLKFIDINVEYLMLQGVKEAWKAETQQKLSIVSYTMTGRKYQRNMTR